MFKASSRSFLVAIVLLAASAASLPVWAQTASSLAPSNPHQALVVVVNNENPRNELPLGELRRMLLGEVTRWPDGRKVTVALREAGQPERDAVLRLICRMSDQDFTRYLVQSAYRGELQGGPKLLDTAAGVRRFVFNVPGGIGFVRSDEVDESVKVMRIAGAIPEEVAFGLTLRAR